MAPPRVNFTPTTYLASFAAFVALFLGLGLVLGYGRIADHLLAQGYLEARPLPPQVQADGTGTRLRWDERLPLASGGFARVRADGRSGAIELAFAAASSAAESAAERLDLGPQAGTQDLRLDAGGRHLFARLHVRGGQPGLETTWLLKYDLRDRRLLRRAAVLPAMLPAPFKP